MTTDESSTPEVSLGEAFWTWCRVAALSFGGPAGQIAVMHRILVDEKKWIREERFLHALNYCMLLPGPEAQQLATYIGWLMHGTRGGLLAGGLFILPGFLSILTLSVLYAVWNDVGLVQALFFGLKPAVMAIVLDAVRRIGKRVLKNGAMVGVAVAAFVAIFFFNVPFPALIVAAGVVGLIGGRAAPQRFYFVQTPVQSRPDTPPSWRRAVQVTAICLPLWFGPLAAIYWLGGRQSVFFQQGVFFSQAAVVTFGGAYSVLAYIAQQAVETHGWLKPGEMLDGLGMAETTPGPLIMVTQFVGFLGAYRNPGELSPLVAGLLGSVLTTWVTFVPCFYWIFLGAPYVERLRGNRPLNAAMSTITAAVVGVVLNLAVWFSLHTLFASVRRESHFGLRLWIPELQTLQLSSLAIAAIAFWLTFSRKQGMATTLAISTAIGAATYFVGR